MTNETERPSHTPWHFWAVFGVWFLWNALAATDYVMNMVQGDAYYTGLSPAQIAYYKAVPLWAEAMHTLSVWGGVISVVFLAMKHRFAVWGITGAAIGTAGYCLYVYVLSDGIPPMGDMWFMPVLVCVLMVGLAQYAKGLRRAGLLK